MSFKKHRGDWWLAGLLGVLLVACMVAISFMAKQSLWGLVERGMAEMRWVIWLIGLILLGALLLLAIQKAFQIAGWKRARHQLQQEGENLSQEEGAHLTQVVCDLASRRGEIFLLSAGLIGVLLSVARISWEMGLNLLITDVAGALITWWCVRIQRPICQKSKGQLQKLRVYLSEALNGQQTIQAYNLESQWIGGCKDQSQTLYEGERKRASLRCKLSGAVWLLGWGGYLFGALWGGSLVLQGTLHWSGWAICLVWMLLGSYLLRKLFFIGEDVRFEPLEAEQ